MSFNVGDRVIYINDRVSANLAYLPPSWRLVTVIKVFKNGDFLVESKDNRFRPSKDYRGNPVAYTTSPKRGEPTLLPATPENLREMHRRDRQHQRNRDSRDLLDKLGEYRHRRFHDFTPQQLRALEEALNLLSNDV